MLVPISGRGWWFLNKDVFYVFLFLYEALCPLHIGLFCVAYCITVVAPSLLVMSNIASLWTEALQAPLSMEFSGQKFWSGLPFPSSEDLPNPGTEPESPMSFALQVCSLPLNHQGSQWCIAFHPTKMVCQTIPRWLSLEHPTAFVSITREFDILQDMHPLFIAVSSKYTLISSNNLKQYALFFRISFVFEIFFCFVLFS